MRRRYPLLALAGAMLIAVPAGAQPVSPPISITRPVQLTKADPVPVRTYATPVVAVDPENPLHIVAAGAEMRSRTCGVTRSIDGGQTWKQLDVSPMPKEYPFCFITETGVPQANVAFGRNHTLYYASPGWDVSDTQSDWQIGTGGGWRGNVSVILSRSTDLGDSWTSTVVRQARGRKGAEMENNRPVTGLVVDTRSGPQDIVYVGWGQAYQDRELSVVATSTDGGRTFGDPVSVSANYLQDEAVRAELGRAAGRPTPTVNALDLTWPAITVDGTGALYAVWHARGRPGPPMDDSATYLSRSTDQGKTFTVTPLGPPSNTFLNPAVIWSAGGGPQGTLHLVYHAVPRKIDFEFDVFHRRSTDGGATWSDAKLLNDDDPAELYGSSHPSIAEAPNGRLDVAWWDFRNEAGTFGNDVYMTSSSDNGSIWTKNLRVTDRSIDRRIGPWYGNADIRQAPGLASRNEYTLVVWDDTRNGDEVTQTQDVYASTVQYEALGGGASSAAKYALAAVIGFGAVGLGLAVVALAIRRREPRRAPDREPAPVS